MINIEVIETVYDIRCLYDHVKTKHERALVGYMAQMGHLEDGIAGGALALLNALREKPKAETYRLTWENEEVANQIIKVTEAVRAGVYRRFTLSRLEVKRIKKNIKRLKDKDKEV